MTARRGLDGAAVVDAARSVLESEGIEAMTLSAVARHLGVKPPSLYNHVSNLDSLRRDVALQGVHESAHAIRSAAMGRSGNDALAAMATAIREYARAHPALYTLTAQARPEDDEYSAAQWTAVEPMIAVLDGWGITGDEAIHAARAFRSSVHGFVSLEVMGGFGIDVDLDESFSWLVDRFAPLVRP